MLGIERRQKILSKIQQERKVYVNELAGIFNVTEETVRRDLEKLEKQKFLHRSYGGAVLNEHTYDDISFSKYMSLLFPFSKYTVTYGLLFSSSLILLWTDTILFFKKYSFTSVFVINCISKF